MLLAEDHTPVGTVEACHLAIRTAYFEMPPTQLEKIATARTVGVAAKAMIAPFQLLAVEQQVGGHPRARPYGGGAAGGISGNVANPQPTVVPAGVLGTVGVWASARGRPYRAARNDRLELGMPMNRGEIEAKMHMSDEERAAYWLRRVVRQIDVLEEVIGLARLHPDMPLLDRLARLGCSKIACDELEALVNAVDDLKQGSPLAPDIQRLLADCEAAEHVAHRQGASIVGCAA